MSGVIRNRDNASQQSESAAISTRKREVLDFAVVGDGPVGLCSALALNKLGRSVVLIGAKPPVELLTAATPLDLRVYALAPDVLKFLATLGCNFQAQPRACAYSSMRVFDDDEAHVLEFNASDYGWSDLGCIVEHQCLQAELWAQVQQMGIKHVIGQADSYQTEDEHAVLHTANDTVRARWVLDASGANSKLRAAAGVRMAEYDYQQSAIVAHVRTETAHAHIAWQRFTAAGTIALLPMFDGSEALVYSALEAKADALMKLDAAGFLADLDANFGLQRGHFTQIGARRKIPLRRMLANDYVLGHLILLGDSGHAVHPLAGQGLNLGIRDVARLMAAVNEALADLGGENLGGAKMRSALRKFERERKSENAITAYGIEALQKLFLPASGPLKLLRNLGLRGVHRLVPVKRLFAELAAGQVAGWPG